MDPAPVAPGKYDIILRNDAMASILGAFAGMFSADAAQKGLSPLAGREGEDIAAECVTLMDDPLYPINPSPFDDEGTPSVAKAVIKDGKLETLLHNLKTAKKQGVETTGNASKPSYASPVGVAPHSMQIKPSDLTRGDLLKMADGGVFITEAIWTRYMPLMATLKELVWSGVIGKPRTLSANLCYPISHKERIMRPDLGGGALLDIGVYTLNFASMVFGNDISRIDTSCQKTATGMDAQHTITLWYGDGRMATLYSSIYAKSDRMGVIAGDDGHIIVENINNPSSLRIVDRDYNVVRTLDAPPQVTGFEYEVGAAVDALDHGDIESHFMPHSETLRMMGLMDELRRRWDVRFPSDGERL